MPVNIHDDLGTLSLERQTTIKKRAEELIAEEKSLQELRKALKLTQASLAKRLGVKQVNVSRLEQQSDLLISTLRKNVQAMGGKLYLIVEFPDRPPVQLKGLSEEISQTKSKAKRKECRAHT